MDTNKDKRTYIFLPYLMVMAVFFQIVSDVSAGLIVTILGASVSASVLYFPMTFILSDVLTEVYGYACARRILWVVLIASIGAGVIFTVVSWLPSPDFFEGAAAYHRVFGIMPRILFAGWAAVFSGESANNYVMAVLKVYTKGAYLWLRLIGSTLVGQGVNTIMFYVLAFYGAFPPEELGWAIAIGWFFKVCIEALCLPATYRLITFLKRVEQEDRFDTATNMNPFLF